MAWHYHWDRGLPGVVDEHDEASGLNRADKRLTPR